MADLTTQSLKIMLEGRSLTASLIHDNPQKTTEKHATNLHSDACDDVTKIIALLGFILLVVGIFTAWGAGWGDSNSSLRRSICFSNSRLYRL